MYTKIKMNGGAPTAISGRAIWMYDCKIRVIINMFNNYLQNWDVFLYLIYFGNTIFINYCSFFEFTHFAKIASKHKEETLKKRYLKMVPWNQGETYNRPCYSLSCKTIIRPESSDIVWKNLKYHSKARIIRKYLTEYVQNSYCGRYGANNELLQKEE